MVIDVKPQATESYSDNDVRKLITRYKNAQSIKDLWMPTFEECYEFSLPQRESF